MMLFPTHVGMIRRLDAHLAQCLSFPHARGDDPNLVTFE